MEFFTPVWPDVLLQILLAWMCLIIFAPSSSLENSPSFLKTVGCATFTSLCMLGMSLVIEHYLSPIIFQTSLVFQWVFFTLLGHKFCAIPLGKSMLAQFCFFSLMLGSGLLLEDLRPQEPREPAPTTSSSGMIETGARQLETALLTRRLTGIRREIRTVAYGGETDQTDSGTTWDEPPSPTVEPPPAPQPTATPEADIAEVLSTENPPPQDIIPPEPEAPAVSDPTLPVPESTEPVPEPTPPPRVAKEPDPIKSTPRFTEPQVLQGEATLGSSQINEMADVKNRSTDKRFTPPDFVVTAVSIGDRGGYVMVDGRLLGQGAVLTTGNTSPRGWKLLRVTEKELFWQPLK